eukprot:scaffold41833_cov35-Attheya_sp.AAC.4
MCKEQSLSDLPKSFKPLHTPCPICIVTKGKHIPRNPTVDIPLEPGTRLHMDFTFFNVPSIRKFTSAFTIIDVTSTYPWGFPSRSKRLPISIFQWFISVLQSMGKKPLYIRVDEGGELAKSAEFCRTIVDTTGGYASNLNEKIETMHGTSKHMTRALLQARSHADDIWCFAFTYSIFIISRTINSRIKMTPHKKWHSIKPSFKDLTVFGCHVYVLNATKTHKVLDSITRTDLRDVITNHNIDVHFMGYSNTTKKHTPGALLLAECATGHQNYVPPPPEDMHLTVSQFDVAKSAFPAKECHTYQVDIPPQGQRFYIQVRDDIDFYIPYLDKLFRESPWLRTLPPTTRRNMWIVSINAEEPIMGANFIDIIKLLQHPTETTTAERILAKRDPTAVTSYQGHRAIFDQMRPIISHMTSLPMKPTVQSNIGTALKSPDRYHWKEACFSQYDKNAEANAFSKPIPVSALPKDTPVYRSVIQPGVKPTGVPDLWKFIARHCANGAGMEKKYFELTTKEGPKLSYLNLEIHQSKHYISIDQTAHIREIVQEWFPDEAELRTTDTPFHTDNEYEQIISKALPAEPAELIDLVRQYGGQYCTSLGKFQHVKEWTSPDLSYATSHLSSFNVAPTEPAFQGLKQRIARYLASHPDKPIYYPRNVDLHGSHMLHHQFDHETYAETPVLNAASDFQSYLGVFRHLVGRQVYRKKILTCYTTIEMTCIWGRITCV